MRLSKFPNYPESQAKETDMNMSLGDSPNVEALKIPYLT